MSALVKLTVGEVGRSGGRARRPPAGAGAGAASPSEAPAPGASVWCCTWSDDGPINVGRDCPDEPALALALSPQDAEAVREGRLAPSVAFMQGRLKTAGDNALLLRVLEWTATPAFEQARRQLS